MKVTVKKEGDVALVLASGEIDAVTCGELQEHLERLLKESCNKIVLDLEEVTYISSAGLRVILATAQKLYGTGGFAISRTAEEVRSILEMVGLASIISLCDSQEEAINLVSQ